MTRLLSILLVACSALGQDTIRTNQLWTASVTTFAATAATDIASSYTVSRDRLDVREMNPFVFGTQDGRFTGRTVAVQGGITAGLIAAQYLAVRKWPQTRRFFTVLNFGLAGTHAWAAQHNWRLK